MKRHMLIAALFAGLIAAGFCLVGTAIPFRPLAMSELAWCNAWGMTGMIVGCAIAMRFVKAHR